MLNVDGKKTGDNGEEMSDEDNGRSLSNLVEKRLILPNLNQKPGIVVNAMNNSIDEQIKYEEDFNLNNNVRESNRFDDSSLKQDPYKPKMYFFINFILMLLFLLMLLSEFTRIILKNKYFNFIIFLE